MQDELIVCCQPRKIAAVSLAQQVAKELGCQLGSLVGYRVGADSRCSDATRILFVTDQVLVNEAVVDRSLTAYACLVLDEVHERSVNTDLLLGLVKEILAARADFRLVIASATMNSQIFLDYFCGWPKEVNIPGRTYPIDFFYEEGEVSVSPSVYMTEALAATRDILATTDEGDILVFVATPGDTDTLCSQLKAKNPDVCCLQLHGKLQVEEQRKVFEQYDQRKVVFATNCAETSITVPGNLSTFKNILAYKDFVHNFPSVAGIVFVVDTGVAKEKQFDPIKNVSSLRIQSISQSSANQRSGRAGRTQPGVCHRLYSEATFLAMRTNSLPEIKRLQLGQTVLKLLSLGISRPEDFDYIESPGWDNIRSALGQLAELGAVNIDWTAQVINK